MLVATDVCARGLDIPNVDLVVQLEPPQETEQYIHRAGRTARAGKSGVCITLFEKRNEWMLGKIEEEAGIQFKVIHPQDISSISLSDPVQPKASPQKPSPIEALLEQISAVDECEPTLAKVSYYL